MPSSTYYFTTKFGGSAKNFISHVNLSATADAAAIQAAIDDLQELTTDAEADNVEDSGGYVVSVSQSLQRILATANRLETNDMELANPHLITGRMLYREDVGSTEVATRPFILRGVDPFATLPASLPSGTPENYVDIAKAFLLKYGRVAGHSPTSITISKDTLMH